jgi:hypothetical protein
VNEWENEEQSVLGDPPPLPDTVWEQAMTHALDPWAVPAQGLVPDPGENAGSVDVDLDDGTASFLGSELDLGGWDDPQASDGLNGFDHHDHNGWSDEWNDDVTDG